VGWASSFPAGLGVQCPVRWPRLPPDRGHPTHKNGVTSKASRRFCECWAGTCPAPYFAAIVGARYASGTPRLLFASVSKSPGHLTSPKYSTSRIEGAASRYLLQQNGWPTRSVANLLAPVPPASGSDTVGPELDCDEDHRILWDCTGCFCVYSGRWTLPRATLRFLQCPHGIFQPQVQSLALLTW
jgi:hypothetical protein